MIGARPVCAWARPVCAWLAVGLAVGSLLAGCGGSAQPGGSATGFIAGDGSAVLLPPDQRQPAPGLTANRLPAVGQASAGAPLSLTDLRGQVVVLNVWASWCGPCRAEAGLLEAAFTEYADAGVSFLGVATRDSIPAAQAFVDRFGITFPTVVDPDGVALLGFADTLPPNAIPSTLLLDREHRVAARVLGPIDASLLDGLISLLLAESAADGADASGAR